jgi:hypothetical protein
MDFLLFLFKLSGRAPGCRSRWSTFSPGESVLSHGRVRFFALFAFLLATSSPTHAGDNGCRTGGAALADAYVLANPVYSLFFGSLESYLAVNNKEHFRALGDSVRCATALSQAFLGSTIELYDPNKLRLQQELEMRLREMGVLLGKDQPTAAGQLYAISMQLSRIVRVLPAAADGNYEPLRAQTNELEQWQMFARQTLLSMIEDRSFWPVLAQAWPLIRDTADLEHQLIRQAAKTMAYSE